MNYLQANFKGRKLNAFTQFLADLDIEGGWVVHSFVLQSKTSTILYYFQFYNKRNGAYILTKTHRILNKTNNYLDMEIKDFYDSSKFIIDKIYLKTIGKVEDELNIQSYLLHIETLLLS